MAHLDINILKQIIVDNAIPDDKIFVMSPSAFEKLTDLMPKVEPKFDDKPLSLVSSMLYGYGVPIRRPIVQNASGYEAAPTRTWKSRLVEFRESMQRWKETKTDPVYTMIARRDSEHRRRQDQELSRIPLVK